jgi:Family of unknown function (DUF6338)
MNPFTSETIRLVFIFFVPGFISMKVYSLLIPSDPIDFSKALLEAVSFSCLNFALLYVPIVTVLTADFESNHPIWYYITSFIVIFFAPIIWPILYKWIVSTKFIRRRTLHPIQKPWDYVFGKKKPYWVIVHLKDGRRIGGSYSLNSFASSYPSPEQIYLEELWQLDQEGRFIKRIDRSDGIIISANDFQAIELFQY